MLTGDLVSLVPVTVAHVPELRRILRTPEVQARWGEADAEPGWPLEEPEVVCFAIVVDDEVRGLIQYGEEEDPGYRHASLARQPVDGPAGGRTDVSELASEPMSQGDRERQLGACEELT